MLSLLDSYLGVVLQIAGTVIVSRLLTPEEVGVFAIAAVFSAFASTFRDFGVAEYLIQEKDLNSSKIKAAFGMNIIVSWAMAATLLVIAWPVGIFYEHAGVTSVLLVLALNFLVIPFGAVTMAWFRRELDYRPIIICNTISNIVAFVSRVYLAFVGFGYMSLAWSALIGVVASVVAIAFFRPSDFPRLPSFRGIREVFHFGKYASGIYILSKIGGGAPELVIGKTAGIQDVGIYSRAFGVVELFNRLLMRPVLQVCLPYFSKSSREGRALSDAYLRGVAMITGVGWSFLAAAAVLSFPIIRLIYGDQWLDAVPFAQVLCLAAALDLVHLLSREVLLAAGQPKIAGVLQVRVVLWQLLGLLLAIPFGTIGACWGLVGAAALSILSSQATLSRTLSLTWDSLVRACIPGLAVAAVVVIPLWVMSTVVVPISENNYVYWLLGAAAYAIPAWTVALAMFRHVLFDELRPILRRLSIAPRSRM